MHDLRDLRPVDPRTAAKHLRIALMGHNIDLSGEDCLDLVARQFGLKDRAALEAEMAAAAPPPARLQAPPGWSLGGVNLDAYSGGIAPGETHLDRPVFRLRNATRENGHATLSQVLSAEAYKGKRVRYAGWLRTGNVDGTATIFMGSSDRNRQYLSFNNLEHLAREGVLHGTCGWSHRAIVMNIPEDAVTVNIGFTLVRGGEAWFSGLGLDIVGPEVPVTANDEEEKDAPANLDFTALTAEGAAQ